MKKHGTLLIVDDNRNILTTVKMLLDDYFEEIIAISNPNNIPARLHENKPDVVLLDMNFNDSMNSGNEGLFWLNEIKQKMPSTQVVLFTAYADIELAVKGLKDGAADFIVKPFDNAKMIETLCEARDKVNGGRTKTGKNEARSEMHWGTSPAMLDLRAMVEKVAATDANILITGENGTGKEVLAKEIHRLSMRAKAKMMPIDMGAITETLFESELFGHVKGAFTDAKADRPGKFELAEGGTLFLDEIGNLSYALQAKLLTALQRRCIVRVGGSEQIPIDVRLLCATNRNLQEMVARGEFREDLLYRINTIHLHLPALRERKEDIVPLAEMFLKKYAAIYNKDVHALDDKARIVLSSMPWHGNIRELQHVIEKAVILDAMPGESDFPEMQTSLHCDTPSIGEVTTLSDMERTMIEKAIVECDGNLSLVASRLGVSRQTLYNKIKRYGL